MTARLVLGIDPGQSGAIALLADNLCDGFIDMPTMARKAGGNEVDAVSLADQVRAALARHPGAYRVAQNVPEHRQPAAAQEGRELRRTGAVTKAPPVVDQRRYPPLKRVGRGLLVVWMPARAR